MSTVSQSALQLASKKEVSPGPARLAGALSEAELDAVGGGVVRMAAWPPPPGRN
jgi:hypothetical protein